MKKHFRDKIVIVTGGASGIGRELCMEMGRLGSNVTVTDLNAEGAQQVAQAIVSGGGRARAVTLDVANAEDVQRVVHDTADAHGRLDFMFNNAGITLAGEVGDMTLDQWRRILAVNLLGVIYGTTTAYSLMLKQGSGHIVNTASYLGLVGFPLTTAYNTTKFAVVGLSTSLREEAVEQGVRVSVVCPGYVLTNLIDDGTMLKISADDAKGLVPFNMYDAAKSAQRILKGVARNKAIIVFPLHARFFWLLNRIHRSLLIPAFRKFVRDFRSLRRD